MGLIDLILLALRNGIKVLAYFESVTQSNRTSEFIDHQNNKLQSLIGSSDNTTSSKEE